MPVRATPQVRADEKDRKEGLTFQDLCDLVDQGREIGIDADTVITGDTWITNRIKDRDGYRIRWLAS